MSDMYGLTDDERYVLAAWVRDWQAQGIAALEQHANAQERPPTAWRR